MPQTPATASARRPRRGRRTALVAVVGALTLLATMPDAARAASAGATPAAQDAASPSSVSASSTLPLERRGTLATRPAGMPVAGSSDGHRLRSATFRHVLSTGRVSGKVVLRAWPQAGQLVIVPGRLSSGSPRSCDQQSAFDIVGTTLTGTPDAGFQRSGATITYDLALGGRNVDPWNCAFAAVVPAGTEQPSDVLIGSLPAVMPKPAFKVGAPTLLGSPSLRLVRGYWTEVRVQVRNTGTGRSGRVTLQGSGSGVQMRGVALSNLAPGELGEFVTTVRVTSNAARSLRLTVRSAGASAQRTVAVRPTARPARPTAGSYRSSDNTTTFRIDARGRLTGFRTYAQTTCGGYPDIPRTTMNYYDFPTVAVPGNGVVQRVQRGSLFTARLQMRIEGSRVSGLRFSYSGPDQCRAVKRVTMRRVGR